MRSGCAGGFLLGLLLLVRASSPALAWQYTLNGDGSGDDHALAVVLDSAGDVLAAGYTTPATPSTSFTVAKLSGLTGLELWRRDIQGSAIRKSVFSDAAFALAIDGAGDVLAVGVTESAETEYDFTVVKLAGNDGTELWRRNIHGSDPNYQAFALTVAADPFGDVLAAGFAGNLGRSADFLVVKLSGGDGSELWRKTINGPSSIADYAFALLTDDSGDVAAGGELWHYRRDIGNHPDYLAVKLSGRDGSELWRVQAELGDIQALAVDPGGDIFGGGYGAAGLNNALALKAAGSSGTVRWLRSSPGFGSGILSMAVDHFADVLTAGQVWRPDLTGWEGEVQRLSGRDGGVLWSQRIIGSGVGYQSLSALALDSSQDALVAGTLVNSGTGYDFAVAKLLGTDGGLLWTRFLSGSGDPGASDAADGATALGLDDRDDVLAGGSLFNGMRGDDFVVVKLCGGTGADFPPDLLSFVQAEIDFLEGADLQRGVQEALRLRLQIVRRLLGDHPERNRAAVAGLLDSIARFVAAQRDRGIPPATASQILLFTAQVRSLLPAVGEPPCAPPSAAKGLASIARSPRSSAPISVLRELGLLPDPLHPGSPPGPRSRRLLSH